ncbi:MAG: sensor histidine kinase [Acidimicrobiales bacterium]
MKALLSSLKVRIAVSMVVPAVLLVIGAFFGFRQLDRSAQRAGSVSSDVAAAAAVASAAADPSVTNFRAFQTILGDDQLLVYRGGRRVFAGPPNPDHPQFTVTRDFPGGQVVIIGDVEGTTLRSLELTGIAALVLAVLMASIVGGVAALTRSVREPVARAVEAADRVAGGDLGARIGEGGPEPFRRLARAFDGMASRLEESDLAQRRFLADLAHEIATPVNAITGVSSAVLDLAVENQEDRTQAAELLRGETERIRTLLDDLRRAGSEASGHRGGGEAQGADQDGEAPAIAAGAPAGAADPVLDLAEVVASLARRFGGRAEEAGLALTTHGPSIRVAAETQLVETVLDNLVTNAVRYTEPGGRIDLGTGHTTTGEVVVSVGDTGIGIGAEHLAHVFDRFYRVDQARARSAGGSGLGLAIARQAAVDLGGRIEVDSTPGTGTEFRLVLPPAVESAGQVR